jgi:hypothetical protein
MATLVAPAPYAVFSTRGLRYTADANCLITATSGADIQDLIFAGCSALNVGSLPSSLPSASGVLWNNGGVLSVS